jgi:hypothetical protein
MRRKRYIKHVWHQGLEFVERGCCSKEVRMNWHSRQLHGWRCKRHHCRESKIDRLNRGGDAFPASLHERLGYPARELGASAFSPNPPPLGAKLNKRIHTHPLKLFWPSFRPSSFSFASSSKNACPILPICAAGVALSPLSPAPSRSGIDV